jgi:signal transduction histidine kinase
MSADVAAPAGRLQPELQGSQPAPSEVLAEQVTLLARQWVRVPFPVLLLTLYIGYLAWPYVAPAALLGWALITVGALLARMFLCLRLQESGKLAREPERWARRLAVFALGNGIVSGAIALLLFPALPPIEQAILMMLLCLWGVGAVAANSAYPPAYYAFSSPLFAQVAAGWLTAGAPDPVFVMAMLALLVTTALVFARDSGRVILESIRLRFANERLLAQKEQLITLLRAAYEKAESARARSEEANRSKSQFLASASHDLRQPLHALSLLTALLNDMTEDTRVREVGRHIDQSVQSLDRLFSALLDLSKLDAGAVVPELRELDVADLVERLSVEYRPKAEDKGLHYEVDCEPLWVRADPILLERILRNLLENAVRFTHAGRVSARARRAGGDAVLSVSDTGIGIPKAEHARIFEEFYQLHNPGRDRHMGLGLGLSVVRRLANLLGYRVELNSSPGQGSVFSVTLPGAVVRGPDAPAPAAQVRESARVDGLTVLLVEDDAEVRNAMELTLRRWGCEAMLAASLEEARALLARSARRPDVLLSDLRLGEGANGIETIDALRAQLGELPAAIVTGDIASERLLEVGATGLPVLHKPVQPEALRDLLFSLARSRG